VERNHNPDIIPSVPVGAEEETVVRQNLWCQIRTLFEQGLNKSAIARDLGVDLKTVRKWLSKAWEPQKRERKSVLDTHESFLRARAPEVGYNAAVLYRELEGRGYGGSYPSLVKYIRPWREEERENNPATARFETEPGHQGQVDWGSARVWFETEQLRVHLFVMVLGFSRRIFVRGYLNERMSALLDGHASAFAHFGGRTETILYDNPRTIVESKDETNGEVVWNRRFKDRMDFYGVRIKLCRYYRAQTKGKVESGVKYVKRNALAGRRFRDLDHLNEWLLEWSLTVADERVHGTTHERPSERFRRAEADALLPVDIRPTPEREQLEHRIVPRDTYVVVETNRYPAPIDWVGNQVEVRILPDRIVITHGSREPLDYPRLMGKFTTAHWTGTPRSWPGRNAAAAVKPPRLDPAYPLAIGEVELRSLAAYEALIEEVGR
jgi:transposase